jgi:glucokinase
VIGVDVGGTRIRAVVLDDSCAVRHQVVRATPPEGGPRLAGAVVACVEALQQDEVTTIGLVTPGSVDPDTGAVRRALNLGIGDQPLLLGPAVSALTGWTVLLGNDVDSAAVAAHRLLGLDDDLPSALLSIGTGIAAGIVVGGVALTGARRSVGEIGHVQVASRGPRCRCGARGCLEAIASGGAISRRWPRSVDGSVGRSLFTESSRGARRTRAGVLDALAVVVEMLDALVDPQCIVLGGGVSEVGDPLLSSLQARLSRRTAGRLLTREPALALAPVPGVLGALGAALSTRSALVP